MKEIEGRPTASTYSTPRPPTVQEMYINNVRDGKVNGK